MNVLRLHKVADKDGVERIRKWVIDNATGEPRSVLLNPETGAASPWPLLGVELLSPPPPEACLPTKWVLGALAEGWVSLEKPTVRVEPVGDQVFTFLHCSRILVHLSNGDLVYSVARQPGRQSDGEVLHDYGCELVESPEV